MGLFQSKIKTQEEMDRELTQRAFGELAASVSLKKETKFFSADETDRTDSAVIACLQYLGAEPGKIPDSVKDPDERIEWLCRPSGTMYRKVVLNGKWYRKSFGAMMGHLQSGDPVALLPRGISGYSCQDPETGERLRLNGNNADRIGSEALLFYKALPAEPVGKRQLAAFIRDILSWRDYLPVFLSALAVTLIGLVPAVVYNIALNMVIPTGQASLLIPILLFLMGEAVASGVLSSCRSLCLSRLDQKLTVVFQSAFFARLLSLPASFFRDYAPGDLAKRVSSISTILQTALSSLLGTGLSVLLGLIYVFQIYAYAPALTVPALVIVLAEVVFFVVMLKAGTWYKEISMKASSSLSGMETSLLKGVQKLRLAGAQKRAFAKWAHNYAKYARYTYQVPVLVKGVTVAITLIGMLGNIWLYYCAASSGVSVANYMSFSVAYGCVTGAVTMLAMSFDQIIQIRPMYQLLRPVLEASPETDSAKPGVDSLSGDIEVSKVAFRYDENAPWIFEDLSFQVRSGEYVAIVGKSGCGKSTILRLLLGMEKPERGSVFYDSYDVSTVDIRSLRQQLGVVMQDGSLFAGDILNNITVAAGEAGIDDAWKAAELAGIADDIRRLPMGINTIISEGGGGFSGGQKQRILIARAVCGNPRILLLDEATSALDNKTQKHVVDSLAKLACTRIVIAHRLSTVKDCDRILVLDKGKISEEGTYEDLIKKGGLFCELVKRQQLEE